jgi:hypothetical protein
MISYDILFFYFVNHFKKILGKIAHNPMQTQLVYSQAAPPYKFCWVRGADAFRRG